MRDTVYYLFFIFISLSGYAYAEEAQHTQTQGLNDIQQVVKDVQQYYIYPVEQKSLYDNAIQGMMTGLDPHCTYFDNQALHDLNTTMQGEFAGVGLEITMDKGLIRVVAPLDDSPAQQAHIQSGDTIIRLNGSPVLGMTLRAAINAMRGPVNSTLTLTIIHPSQKAIALPTTITLKRKIIHIQSVKSDIIDHTEHSAYGYIKITQFQLATPQEVQLAIKKLKKESLQHGEHLSGLILDLRNNPGGLFDSAVAIANDFIDIKKKNVVTEKSPIIVSTKGRSPQSTSVTYATQGDIITGVPMVVLINGGSASSAEILAGALKDNHRAILLGTKTFGKGSVQTLIPVTKNSAIKLTTALYYTPNGTSIQAQGIKPDIEVKPLEIKTSVNQNQLTEADLLRHLTNKDANSSNSVYQNINNLKLQHDSVVYQALNILKGLALQHE